jgi:hypothetical protein
MNTNTVGSGVADADANTVHTGSVNGHAVKSTVVRGRI